MTGAHARRGRPARLAATTGCTFAATLGATLVIGSSAAAAPASQAAKSGHHPAAAHAASPAPSPRPSARFTGRPASGHSAHPGHKSSSPAPRHSSPPGHAPTAPKLQTLFRTVRVFTAATKHAGIKGKIGRRGTTVHVACWTTGMYYGNGPIWYEISAPLPGYVSAFDLTAHDAPASGIAHCHAPAFTEQFNSLVPDLAVHVRASSHATISGYLVSMGTSATVRCYVLGTPSSGDPTWYHVISPANGYVSGHFLNTGGDPAPGVPPC
jgi:hypothetical protein